MSFIQCKDRRELEVETDKDNHAPCFVSPDHRIYKEVELSFRGSYAQINAETMEALFELHDTIAMLTDGHWEQNLLDVDDSAKLFTQALQNAINMVRKNPITRKGKA